jgi:hypothetical protein
VHSADGKLVKRFNVMSFDDMTGSLTHSGYTEITLAEYETLAKESKVFSHFLGLKTLKRHEALPEEAMTPHDALMSAKREAAEYEQLTAELEKENAELKKEIEALKAKSGKGGASS